MVTKIKTMWAEYKKTLTKRTVMRTVWHYFLMLVGSTSLAFGTAIFILPYEIVTGGISGIALVLSNLTNFPSEHIITILTWSLFFLGMLLLGIKFSLKTLVATIFYPIMVYLFGALRDNVTWLTITGESAMLLAGIFGGVFVGAGCGITYVGGGSTGGVDCISLSLNKYAHIKASVASFIIDSTIIACGLLVYQELYLALIGIISAFVCALMIDRIFLNNSSSYVAFIVTSKFDEINMEINDKLERGTTLVHAEGGYTGDQTKMIQVAFDRKEYPDIQSIVARIDPKAFMSIVHAHEINGYGFKRMPSGSNVMKRKIRPVEDPGENNPDA